ncbi:hypothetical protein [Nocardioides sp. SYSU DS0663]|uniref:hypothetical protein n=1 Tax=Nocardioides sp. SYSU DS0663 TaxID=3416445 RepID=UPI003F4C3A4A
MAPRTTVGSLVLLVSLALLAGCGGTPDRPAPSAEETPASSGGPGRGARTPDQEPTSLPVLPDDLEDEAAMADLAARAEQEAGRAPEAPEGPIEGGDISWPQCPRGMGIPERRTLGLPMPLPSAEFVIMGLTNGPAFFPNPCLADQVAWVRERGLLAGAYAVASYPDDRTLAAYGDEGPFDGAADHDDLRNVGYQQALFNITQMREAGLPSPMIWIDVEPVRDWEWSADLEANAAVVEGLRRGYLDKGYRIGIYSTPALWAAAVGDLALGVPEWRAAGPTSRAEALERCGPAWVVQGGRAAIGQWVEGNRDLNVTCPGAEGEVLGWFHRF